MRKADAESGCGSGSGSGSGRRKAEAEGGRRKAEAESGSGRRPSSRAQNHFACEVIVGATNCPVASMRICRALSACARRLKHDFACEVIFQSEKGIPRWFREAWRCVDAGRGSSVARSARQSLRRPRATMSAKRRRPSSVFTSSMPPLAHHAKASASGTSMTSPKRSRGEPSSSGALR